MWKKGSVKVMNAEHERKIIRRIVNRNIAITRKQKMEAQAMRERTAETFSPYTFVMVDSFELLPGFLVHEKIC